MKEETLLLEKVKPNKIIELENHYRLQFNTINNKSYTVFVGKRYIEKEILNLNNYFDVVKTDIYRESIDEVVDDSEFDINPYLKYCGIYSYLTIVPNHTDPAKFNLLT